MTKPQGFPHRQPFCVTPRRNLTKQKAWWQTGGTNNRKVQQKKEEA